MDSVGKRGGKKILLTGKEKEGGKFFITMKSEGGGGRGE